MVSRRPVTTHGRSWNAANLTTQKTRPPAAQHATGPTSEQNPTSKEGQGVWSRAAHSSRPRCTWHVHHVG
eukprot:114646-Chlamydomonas_euryale.AAC.1